MGKKDHFTDGKVIKFKVDGETFGYLPISTGEMLDWASELSEIDEKGNPTASLKRISERKVERIVEVPYSKQELKEVTGLDKEWNKYTAQEKMAFFRKMKYSIFSEIANEIQKINSGESDALKNC